MTINAVYQGLAYKRHMLSCSTTNFELSQLFAIVLLFLGSLQLFSRSLVYSNLEKVLSVTHVGNF